MMTAIQATGVTLLAAMMGLTDPPAESNDDLLAGPRVDEQAEQQTGGMMGDDRRRAETFVELTHQQWMSALRGLKLEADQRQAIGTIMNEFGDAQRKFMEGLTEEQRDVLSRSRRDRDEPSEMREPPRRLRELLMSLEGQRPKVEPYQQRIWEVLDASQQVQMKQKLDEMKQEIMDRQRERREARRAAAAEGESGDMMKSAPESAERPDTPPQADQGDHRRRRAAGLDEMAERRLRFLTARQAGPHQPRHVEGVPSAKDRQFNFEESPNAPHTPER